MSAKTTGKNILFSVYNAAHREMGDVFDTEIEALNDAKKTLEEADEDDLERIEKYELYIVKITAVGYVKHAKTTVTVSLDRKDKIING